MWTEGTCWKRARLSVEDSPLEDLWAEHLVVLPMCIFFFRGEILLLYPTYVVQLHDTLAHATGTFRMPRRFDESRRACWGSVRWSDVNHP